MSSDPKRTPFPRDILDDTRPVKRPRNGPVDSALLLDRHGPPHVAASSSASHPVPSTSSSEPIPHPNELRRRQGKRPTLSCAECRRLKLKCDRTFPCASCTKRGCAQICPEGSLQSGRGSRFILANTSQLHEKIIQLSERVKDLEGGLETLQSSVSPGRIHPLLRSDLLKIRSSNDLQASYDATNDDRSPPNTGGHISSPVEQEDYQRQPSYSDHPPHGQTPEGPSNKSSPQATLEVPDDLVALSAAFPVAWKIDLNVRRRIRDLLPSKEDCYRICEVAQVNALWQYKFDGSETFLTNLLYHIYSADIENLSPRRLAMLLMLLAIGSSVDLDQPMRSPMSNAYYHLARACICEIPLIEEPNFDLLKAMFLMIWYMLTFSNNQKDVGYAWNTMGITVKLAHTIGLHRDASRMKMIPEELEQRRAFWWELVHLDCRISLSLGRPPSISLLHSDCQRPSYGEGIYGSKDEATYHEWKHDFYERCLGPILQATVSVKPLDYDEILQLDTQVRDFNVPAILAKTSMDIPAPRFLIMQRVLVCTSREIALLQLHRSSYNRALSGPQPVTMDHTLAPSLLATFCSACSLISIAEELFKTIPRLSLRFLGFWFNAFSAGVALSLLVSRAPGTFLAPLALNELDRLRVLWRKVMTELTCCGSALSAIERSAGSSRRIYVQWLEESRATGRNNSSRDVPPVFMNAHDFLKDQYSRASAIPHPHPDDVPIFTIGSPCIDCKNANNTASNMEENPLPSVYEFNSGLINKNFSPISEHCAPSNSLCSRVGDCRNLNFDFGALDADRSFMAWF